MEVPKTLLVALMFVTILTLGIANLLGALATVAVHGRRTREGFPLFSWKILLFLVHLGTFWSTGALTTVENWTFAWFLYVLTGPILLLLGTTTLLAAEGTEDDAQAETVFRRTFWIIALQQLWVISTDYMLDGAFDPRTATNGATLIVALAMAGVRPAAWTGVTMAAWAIVAVSFVLRAARIGN